MSIVSRIVGEERLEAQLNYLKDFPKKAADPVFRKHAQHEVKKFRNKPYPPELPNQKYQRTYELRRRFDYRKRGPSAYAITNDRKGAQWVVRRGMQNKKYHLGRWWTVEAEIEKGLPILRDSLIAEIEGDLRVM